MQNEKLTAIEESVVHGMTWGDLCPTKKRLSEVYEKYKASGGPTICFAPDAMQEIEFTKVSVDPEFGIAVFGSKDALLGAVAKVMAKDSFRDAHMEFVERYHLFRSKAYGQWKVEEQLGLFDSGENKQPSDDATSDTRRQEFAERFVNACDDAEREKVWNEFVAIGMTPDAEEKNRSLFEALALCKKLRDMLHKVEADWANLSKERFDAQYRRIVAARVVDVPGAEFGTAGALADDNGWHIVDMACGIRYASGDTLAEAIQNASAYIHRTRQSGKFDLLVNEARDAFKIALQKFRTPDVQTGDTL